MSQFPIGGPHNETVLYISELWAGGLAPLDLLKTTCTLTLYLNPDPQNPSEQTLLFAVREGRFQLWAALNNYSLTVHRNGRELKLQVSETAEVGASIVLNIIWDPEKLAAYFSKSETVQIWKEIPVPIAPYPTKLARQIRLNSKNSECEFDLYDSFLMAVIGIFLNIQKDLEKTGAVSPFWCRKIDKKKTRISPNKEIDSHAIVDLLLNGEAERNSITVSREQHTARGNLDFNLSASIKGEGIKHICIEFKNAHSPDLEDGLTTQLPIYMDKLNAINGIYCVLWFKGEKESRPIQYNNPGDLQYRLTCLLLEKKVRQKIRVMVLDVSMKPSASKAAKKSFASKTSKKTSVRKNSKGE